MLREVGGREQISREVIRPWVARNTGGPNLLGQWAGMRKKKRVPDLRLLRAFWRGARTTREGKGLEGPCKGADNGVWPRKMPNDEVDNDVIEVVSVSSDPEVMFCCPLTVSPAPDVPVTDTECMCVPCAPQRFVCQFEESFRYASSVHIKPKGETCCNSMEDLPR